jgi:hypothetical protein
MSDTMEPMAIEVAQREFQQQLQALLLAKQATEERPGNRFASGHGRAFGVRQA